MKHMSLVLFLGILAFSASAEDLPPGTASVDEAWATTNHFIAANYQVLFVQKRSNTIAEAKATLDLGNGKSSTIKYMSLSDFLEDAWRHGMTPVSVVEKSDDTLTIVLSNSKAAR